MTPAEWSAERVARLQFEPEPNPVDVRGYVATLRDGSRLYPLDDDKVSVAGPRDIVACGHDGRPDNTAAYHACYWPVEITVAEAARQPWPVWLRTMVLRDGKLRPRLVLAEIDVVFVSTEERLARRRAVLTPVDADVKFSQRLACGCGHAEKRSRWLIAANRPSWDTCPRCKSAVRFDEVPARLTLHPPKYPWPTEPGYDVLSCECGMRYERAEWTRQETSHGGCGRCARQLHHDDLYGAYEIARQRKESASGDV